MKIVTFFKSDTYKSDKQPHEFMINEKNMDATFDLSTTKLFLF